MAAQTTFSQALEPNAFEGEGRLAFTGRCFMYWQDGRGALGTVMWGTPREADIEQMLPFFEVGARPCFKGHASFVDGRRLESIDLLAFGTLLAYLTRRRHVWGPNVGRQAVLHPSGFVGVVVAGALHVARPPYAFKTFEDDDTAAFSWCGLAGLRDAYRAQVDTVCALPEVIRRVRAVLHEGTKLKNAEVAQRLGLSERTLQRRLGEVGSSLRLEQERNQTRIAEELLSGTALSLEAVAALSGFHSASHLVRRFKRAHGQTPGAWRAQLPTPR